MRTIVIGVVLSLRQPYLLEIFVKMFGSLSLFSCDFPSPKMFLIGWMDGWIYYRVSCTTLKAEGDRKSRTFNSTCHTGSLRPSSTVSRRKVQPSKTKTCKTSFHSEGRLYIETGQLDKPLHVSWQRILFLNQMQQ